jgi:hypothetical protein
MIPWYILIIQRLSQHGIPITNDACVRRTRHGGRGVPEVSTVWHSQKVFFTVIHSGLPTLHPSIHTYMLYIPHMNIVVKPIIESNNFNSATTSAF